MMKRNSFTHMFDVALRLLKKVPFSSEICFKKVLSIATLSCMVCVSSLQGTDLATEETTPAQTSAPTEVSPLTPPEEETPGTPVSAESNNAQKAAKRRMWQNIAIAIGAVAIAVTALVLVSNHHGNKANNN